MFGNNKKEMQCSPAVMMAVSSGGLKMLVRKANGKNVVTRQPTLGGG